MTEPSDTDDQARWIRLEAHASAMMGILHALIETAADRPGGVPATLATLCDDVERVWRSVHGRLFPD